MKKTLVLIDNIYEQYHLEGIEQNDILFLPMLKSEKMNHVLRLCRKLHLSSFLPFKGIWFFKWDSYINNYETIILGDAGNSYNVAKYIKRNWPNKRVIIWFRNSVSQTVSPLTFDKNVCEVWSFDKADCEEYGMQYNPQFYMKSNQYREHKLEYDAFFIGKDKGRLDSLLDIETTLKHYGYNTKFFIVGYNSSYLSYEKVLENIAKTKIIIDYQGDWQNGITLRPLEALFYKKKLITNNSMIRDSDYYHPNNVFIWGCDDSDYLNEFIKLPYEAISQDIINEYNEIGWVKRFHSEN